MITTGALTRDLSRAVSPALTVAQLTVSSVAMVERHYGQLLRDDAEQALAQLAL